MGSLALTLTLALALTSGELEEEHGGGERRAEDLVRVRVRDRVSYL